MVNVQPTACVYHMSETLGLFLWPEHVSYGILNVRLVSEALTYLNDLYLVLMLRRNIGRGRSELIMYHIGQRQ